jgi:hypothetical protein
MSAPVPSIEEVTTFLSLFITHYFDRQLHMQEISQKKKKSKQAKKESNDERSQSGIHQGQVAAWQLVFFVSLLSIQCS